MVTEPGIGGSDAAGRQFNGKGSLKKYRRQTKRTDGFTPADNNIIAVTEDYINGKFHKKHVNGLALRNNQGLMGREIIFTQQSFHALPGVFGPLNLRGNPGLTGQVGYHALFAGAGFKNGFAD